MKSFFWCLVVFSSLSWGSTSSHAELKNHIGQPIHPIQRTLMSFRETISKIKTVPDLCMFIKRNHRYQHDKGHPYLEDIKSPFRLYKERRGDCEDFAIQAVYIALLKGWNGTVLTWRAKHSAHAFAVIYDHERMWIICNMTLGLRQKINEPMTHVSFIPVDAETSSMVIKLFYNAYMEESLTYDEYISNDSIKENEVMLHETGKSSEQERIRAILDGFWNLFY